MQVNFTVTAIHRVDGLQYIRKYERIEDAGLWIGFLIANDRHMNIVLETNDTVLFESTTEYNQACG